MKFKAWFPLAVLAVILVNSCLFVVDEREYAVRVPVRRDRSDVCRRGAEFQTAESSITSSFTRTGFLPSTTRRKPF